jgi:hypothetical protein
MTHEEIGLEELRAGWAARRGSADDCPADEVLWAAARGEAAAGLARQVAAHLAGCAACTDGWRLARDLGPAPLPAREAGAAFLPGAGRARRATMGWWALSAAAAAAMVALLALEVTDRLRPRSAAPAMRAPEAAGIQSMLPTEKPLVRGDCLLRWSGPAGARYDLRVARVDLTPLVDARSIEATEYRVPAESLAGLPPGARIIWQVKGTLPDGTPLPPATFVATLE